jgi:hypothetical protein
MIDIVNVVLQVAGVTASAVSAWVAVTFWRDSRRKSSKELGSQERPSLGS